MRLDAQDLGLFRREQHGAQALQGADRLGARRLQGRIERFVHRPR